MKNKIKDLSVGVERSIDDLGRIVLPKEMRDALNFKKNQLVSIKLFKDYIQVGKSTKRCTFCNSDIDINYYKNVPVCKECLNDITKNFNK